MMGTESVIETSYNSAFLRDRDGHRNVGTVLQIDGAVCPRGRYWFLTCSPTADVTCLLPTDVRCAAGTRDIQTEELCGFSHSLIVRNTLKQAAAVCWLAVHCYFIVPRVTCAVETAASDVETVNCHLLVFPALFHPPQFNLPLHASICAQLQDSDVVIVVPINARDFQPCFYLILWRFS